MRFKIVAVDPGHPSGSWRIAYTRDGSHTHNRPPSFDVRVHVAHRQRDARRTAQVELTQADLVSVQSEADVSTSRIYATMLARDEGTLVIPKDITNAKGKKEILASSTTVEALLELLEAKKFHYSYETDSANRLQYLMWAHPETTSLARYFMDILVIDCTYKTNKYRIPLFNAIIVTGMSTVLPLAQIWIPGEAESDYTWALSKLRDLLVVNSIPMPRVILTDRELACTNATETVFPTSAKLLCQWHINRNVLAQAQKKIGQVDVQNSVVIGKKKNSLATDIFMAKFYETVASETEEEFNTRSAGLRDLSSSMGKYLDKEWWPYKEKIVKCWTNRFSHFGTLSTSTVEGTHASMKPSRFEIDAEPFNAGV